MLVATYAESAVEDLSSEALAAGMRLARIYEVMRSEARFNVTMFLQSFEAGMAAGVVIRTPARKETGKTAGVPEARFLPADTEVTSTMKC